MRSFLKWVALSLYIVLLSGISFASLPHMKLSAQNLIHNKAKRTVLLKGNAEVSQGQNDLVADRILVDRRNNSLTANGNCKYTKNGFVVRSEEMIFDISRSEWVQKK